MLTPISLLNGRQIDDPAADFRTAKRVEQYRISKKAIYIPSGLRWTYLPLSEIREFSESHRVVSAGKCVSVVEHRPAIDLRTETETFKLSLEKNASMETLIQCLRSRD